MCYFQYNDFIIKIKFLQGLKEFSRRFRRRLTRDVGLGKQFPKTLQPCKVYNFLFAPQVFLLLKPLYQSIFFKATKVYVTPKPPILQKRKIKPKIMRYENAAINKII